MKITLRNSLTQNLVDVQRNKFPTGTLWYFKAESSAYFSVGEKLPLLDLTALVGRNLETEAALQAENVALKATIAQYAEACDPKVQRERIRKSAAERRADPVAWAAKVRARFR